jgi:transposase
MMEVTQAQYKKIARVLPVPRGNVTLSNIDALNAVLYAAEHGCKWRGLPARFGNWRTVYTRMSRRAKKGVLAKVFDELQKQQIVKINLEAVSIDNTSIKVHPDGTGALKKRRTIHREVPWRLDDQDPLDRCQRSGRTGLFPVARPGKRWPGRS